MKLDDRNMLAHLVAAHCGDLRKWPEAKRMCDGKTYDHVAQFDDADDADDADAFSNAVLDDGWNFKGDNDFVKGVYTLFFTISKGEEDHSCVDNDADGICGVCFEDAQA